jgi:hypothetical protein
MKVVVTLSDLDREKIAVEILRDSAKTCLSVDPSDDYGRRYAAAVNMVLAHFGGKPVRIPRAK